MVKFRTTEEVIKKLSMELWVQILPGLGGKIYEAENYC